MKIAQHGAVYGRNFGDVLIQKLVATRLRMMLGADIFFPRGTTGFREESEEVVGSWWNLPTSDAVVFGPGGYLGEREHEVTAWHKRLQKYHGTFFRTVRLSRRPLFVFGVGVGPLSNPTSRRLVSEILDYASFVQLRDEESASYLEDLGVDGSDVRVVPDVALSLSPNDLGLSATDGVPFCRRKRQDSVVGLHLSVPQVNRVGGQALFRNDIEEWIAENPNDQFVLIFDNPGQKLPPDFKKRLLIFPNVISRPYSGVDNLVKDIAGCDEVVTTKLHVGICAAALGVVPIGVYTHRKVERFYKQIGHSAFCSKMADYQKGWLAQAFRKISRGEAREMFYNVEELRLQVRESFEDLAMAITGEIST